MIRRVKLSFVCDVDWSALPGEGSERWCQRCQRTVHDLGALTEAEAQPLLREREQRRVCVVFKTKSDGSIRFREPVAAALTASLLLAACSSPSAVPEAERADDPVVHVETTAAPSGPAPAAPAPLAPSVEASPADPSPAPAPTQAAAPTAPSAACAEPTPTAPRGGPPTAAASKSTKKKIDVEMGGF